MTDMPKMEKAGASLRDRATRASPRAGSRLGHIPCAVADKLREARAMIERGWTQGALARGVSGRVVEETSPLAACFCMSGAVIRACGAGSYPDLPFALLRKATGCEIIPHWNDAPSRTQAEVLAAFDKAIELAEAQS